MVNLYKFLTKEHGEYILSQQLITSCTVIDVTVREADHVESTKNFINNLSIGFKEQIN